MGRRVFWLRASARFFLAAVVLTIVSPAITTAASPAETAALFDEALSSELISTDGSRRELLEKIVATDPDNILARAYLGHVRVDDAWRTVPDAEQAAAGDRRIAEYRQLRDQVGDSVRGHLQLARWCRSHNLPNHARVHWLYVASQQPGIAANSEALRALGMQWHSGRLLSYDQIEIAKQAEKQLNEDLAEWKPRCEAWRRALASKDVAKHDAALAEFAALEDPAAIPALEQVFGQVEGESALMAVQSIAAMKGLRSVEALVRFAVLAPDDAVRKAATAALKDRPKQVVVPMLISFLQAPTEVEFRMSRGPGGVTSELSLFQEGDFANYLWSHRTVAQVVQPPITQSSNPAQNRQTEQAMAIVSAVAAQREAAATAQDVARYNERVAWLNSRVDDVLSELAGKRLGPNPVAWSRWWLDENERYYPSDAPTQEFETSVVSRYVIPAAVEAPAPRSGPPLTPTAPVPSIASRGIGNAECFLRGTPVWTETGAVPIEMIRTGDRVLAQDLQTGELAYRSVLATTLRPPGPMTRLSAGGESIVATLGHHFWVAGKGWQMAKSLDRGTRLHSIAGGIDLEEVAEAADSEAYNLVVDEFHTYFVGQNRLLSHDVTWIEPTEQALPGWLGKSETLAEKPAE